MFALHCHSSTPSLPSLSPASSPTMSADVATSSQGPLLSPQQQVQQIIQTYKAMRANITELASKLTELDSDKTEHQLVLRAITNLPRDRKCYRSIGGVLVERTVGDVQPAVEKNVRGIEELIAKLGSDLKEREREADEFRARYNISMGESKEAEEDEEDEEDEKERGRGGSAQQKRPGGGGVLA